MLIPAVLTAFPSPLDSTKKKKVLALLYDTSHCVQSKLACSFMTQTQWKKSDREAGTKTGGSSKP
jgi:hypothetical protein